MGLVIYEDRFYTRLLVKEITMSKVAIITDSTATIPDSLLARYSIRVAPQLLIWNGDTYQDRIDIQPQEFYTRLKTSKELPTSAQVTPHTFKSMFTELISQGYDVLAVLISTRLSGTVQSAIQAKEMLKGQNIEIVDSQYASMATGFQVLAAARAAVDGASLIDCKRIAELARDNSGVFFVVDTLKYLHAGGRIGGAAHFVGAAFDIKPILQIIDGQVESSEKVRTLKKAHDRMLELVEKGIAGRTPLHLAVLHAEAADQADLLKARADHLFHPAESILTEVSPVIGVHTGPGTLGIAYLAGM
jgi:DegV family protein with EDD domain